MRESWSLVGDWGQVLAVPVFGSPAQIAPSPTGHSPETKELIAGFWIWKVSSLQEAIDWVKKCPNPMIEDSDVEIRPFIEPEDFAGLITPERLEEVKELEAQLGGSCRLRPGPFE